MKQGTSNSSMRLIKSGTAAAVIGILLTMLLLLGVAVLTENGAVPEKMRDPFILASTLIGSAIAGALCAKKSGRGAITSGLSVAAVYIAIVLLGTIINGNDAGNEALSIRVVLAIIAGCIIGGVLKLHRNGKKRKKRR